MKIIYSIEKKETYIHWTIKTEDDGKLFLNPLELDRPKFKASFGLIIDAYLSTELMAFLALHYRNMSWVALPDNSTKEDFLVVKGNKQNITAGDRCWIATNAEREQYLVWRSNQG